MKGMRSMERKTYTTGQVAKMCDVAARTVAKWMDSGKIPGCYRIPGSADRRVPRADLARFLRENGMPVPDALLPEGLPGLLAMTPDAAKAGQLASLLAGTMAVAHARSPWEAGELFAGRRHDAVLFDMAAGCRGCMDAAEALSARDEPPLCFALTYDDTPELNGAFARHWPHGTPARDVAQHLHELFSVARGE